MKKFLFVISAVLLSSLGVILLFECVLGYLYISPLTAFFSNTSSENLLLKESINRDVVYEFKPLAQNNAWGCHVQINSAGFRDREYPVHNISGRRVAVIGDSITFGYKLPPEDTYAKQLERLFSVQKNPMEVINMGCPGYNVSQVVAALEYKGLAFHPDVVVYGFCLNDLMNQSQSPMVLQKYIQSKRGIWFRSRVVQFVFYRLLKRRLADEIMADMESLRQEREASLPFLVPDDVLKANMQGVRDLVAKNKKAYSFLLGFSSEKRLGELRRVFGRLQSMSKEKHFKVVVLILPYLNLEKDGYAPRPAHRIIANEAQRCGFIVRDPLDQMMEAGLDKLQIDAIHPNAVGNRILASAVYDALKSLP